MRNALHALLLSALLLAQLPASAQDKTAPSAPTMNFFFRDAPVAELFEMLSRKERVSIMLSRGVSGNVTVNLYDVTLKQAIHAIAEAAGYAVQERAGGYMILSRSEAEAARSGGNMDVRILRVQYADPEKVAEILSSYLSRGGKLTPFAERKMLVAEGTPQVLDRMEQLLREIDQPPVQVLIEAKILEISLDASDSFGIDWSRIFDNGQARIGTQGLAARSAPGLFFNLVNDNISAYLSALSSKGKVHTLATPKLLTLDNQEAMTNVGDKLGYRVTTTINNVTTESIQFLETGTILRVTPSVDSGGRIAMKIRPEVSSGSLAGGIPSKKTTEVSTQLIAEDGQSILIAGLIKNSNGYTRSGVPVLSEVPGVGRLFSRTERIDTATETVVIITPRIVRNNDLAHQQGTLEKVGQSSQLLQDRKQEIEQTVDMLNPPPAQSATPKSSARKSVPLIGGFLADY